MKKGLRHEEDCLADYEQRGMTVVRIPARPKGETFESWVQRVGNPFADGPDVVYQMPFIHNGMRGIADFVVRTVDESGTASYEPVDAKLARADAKPGHVLQLCFYTDAIEALTGQRPSQMHIWLGSGKVESLRVAEFGPLWRRLSRRLVESVAAGPSADTVAEPNPHCQFCEFQTVCEQQWRDQDALTYVAGLRKTDVEPLRLADITTLAALATSDGAIDSMHDERLTRLRKQSALQLQARTNPEATPPHEMIAPGAEPWGHGLEQLPAPDDGDVFIDFEGHPFWRADAGLFFLFGLLEKDPRGNWNYQTWWAHNPDGEAAAAGALIDYLAERRDRFPDMHVYHYNHTERSALQSLAAMHGIGESTLAELVDTGAFIDLYPVARNSVQAGVESYGLKHLEQLTDFERHHEIDKGAGAVMQYEQFMQGGAQSDLDAIAVYNEDDVRATLALRDWLIEHRPVDMPWREAYTEPDQKTAELNEVIERLHQFEVGSDEHNLGDLLGYWRAERFAYIGPKMAKLEADPTGLLDDPEVIADLSFLGPVERFDKRGKLIDPGKRFAFPPQDTERFRVAGSQVLILMPDGKARTTKIDTLDRENGHVDLQWGTKLREAEPTPASVVLDDWFHTTVKAGALQSFAEDVLDARTPNPVTLALLRGDLPRFAGAGPKNGVFSDVLDEMTDLVTRLDHSFVAVQGPPGTGKTYTAARLIRTLVRANKRVGITAVSHHAISNVLAAVVEAFDESGELRLLNAMCNANDTVERVEHISYGDNKACANRDHNVVAGTTWLFSRQEMRDAPVDVLLVDEAGQLALADALAASGAAHNLVLLGDPLQLPQVAQASHRGIAGRSVLEHIIAQDVEDGEDDSDNPTLSAKRGVFLSRTRRMHPDIYRFISDLIYRGRLGGIEDCARQSTSAGTGLRWLRAEHHGNRTSSPQEAELIVEELTRLIGTDWTNHEGQSKTLGTDDFMVVAPYNNQVNLIRNRLDEIPALAGIKVGTVDKFQGQEAAVVFFSMAVSSGEDIIRGVDFLFSRNRLNVALSRARCLAYLVCTDALLDTRARDVEEMRLIATLNAFVEEAEHGAIELP